MSSEPATPRVDSEAGILHSSVASASSAEALYNVQQLPPIDGGRGAWLFCFSSFIVETLVWGFGFSYGIFQGYYTSHPPFNTQSLLAISAIGPTTLAIEYGSGFILSFLYGRYPELLNPMMWAGLALAVSSLFLSSFVSSVELLILLQGVGLGIGSGMLYWPTIFLIPEWFVEKRGFACGVIFAGSGIGGFLFPFIVNGLLDSVDFRWTLRVWASIMAVLGGLAIFGIRRRIPAPKYHSSAMRPRLIPRNMQFLKVPIFWIFSLAYMFQAMSYFPVSLYIADFTTMISSPLSATIVLSLFNSSSVVGQILIGWLTDRMPYPRVMFCTTLSSSIAAFLLWGFADTLGHVLAFAIVFGGFSRGFSTLALSASADSTGANPEQMSMALTAMTVVRGIAAVTGPVVAGILLEAGKTVTFGDKSNVSKIVILSDGCLVVNGSPRLTIPMIMLVLPLMTLNTTWIHLANRPPNGSAGPGELERQETRDVLTRLMWIIAPLLQVPNLLFGFCEAYMVMSTIYPSLRVPLLHHILLPAGAIPPTPSDFYLSPSFVWGTIFLCVSTYLRITCFRILGRQFTFKLSLVKGHNLITSGPYAVLRHPSYLGGIGGLWGMLFTRLFSPGTWWVECGMWHTWQGKVLGASWITFVTITSSIALSRIPHEDRMLQEKFGEQWSEWAQRTPYAIMPFIW
ncbi:hypothetical protein EUX98_g6779 [Antrodiella citrinella]|uniref:Protein-S-isoprenylcysteine O-methyltransferase n=1 Tax=Antrodiella citrinella TaxID=2447956 RepID=A0A4S4MQ69_9APHY|nr:hypothetical protein EUX98_g6779 [Antrodiella citrinella]